MSLLPHDHVLLQYRTGDTRWRHAVILEKADGVFHRVFTPARVVRRVDFSDPQLAHIVAFDGTNLSKKIDRKRAFLDVDSAKGKFSKREIDTAIRALAVADPPSPIPGVPHVRRPIIGKQPPPIADALADAAEKELPIAEHETIAIAEPKPLEHVSAVSDGEGWYVFWGHGAAAAGSLVKLAGTPVAILGDFALFKKGGRVLGAVWCKAEEVFDKLRDLRIRASGLPTSRFEGLDEIYADKDDTPRGRDKNAAAGAPKLPDADDLDMRILPVKLEKDLRRFRRLQDAEQEMFEEPLDDWPLDGERTLAHALRELRREDRSWLQHHEHWMKVSGVRNNDRSAHEHFSICTALHWFTCYDQYNVVNSAGCEALNARRELIEFAHEGRPEAPRWDGAEEFLGRRGSATGTLIDPRKLAYVAARQAQKAKMLEATAKAREANAAWLRRGGSPDDPQPAAPPKGPKGAAKAAAAAAKAAGTA